MTPRLDSARQRVHVLLRSEATASGPCANGVPWRYHFQPGPQGSTEERSTVFDSNIPDECISACVPSAALRVFDAICVQDFDAPFPRCGWALRWLESAGLIERQHAGRHGVGSPKLPIVVTAPGRALAAERATTVGVGGVYSWGAN